MNPTENIQLSWSEFQTATTRFISSVQNSNDFVDVTLACDDDKMVEAHRVVISAGSSFFEGILRKTVGHPHPLLYLRGIKKEQLDSILTPGCLPGSSQGTGGQGVLWGTKRKSCST